MIKYYKSRGFTDRLYIINFITVQIIVLMVFAITALSGLFNVTDLSAIAAIPPYAYGELALHTGFIVWKAKVENLNKHGNKDQVTM